jgi:hypothetical protein
MLLITAVPSSGVEWWATSGSVAADADSPYVLARLRHPSFSIEAGHQPGDRGGDRLVAAFPVRDAHPMTPDFASERGLRELEPPTDAGERFTIHKANVVSGDTACQALSIRSASQQS